MHGRRRRTSCSRGALSASSAPHAPSEAQTIAFLPCPGRPTQSRATARRSWPASVICGLSGYRCFSSQARCCLRRRGPRLERRGHVARMPGRWRRCWPPFLPSSSLPGRVPAPRSQGTYSAKSRTCQPMPGPRRNKLRRLAAPLAAPPNKQKRPLAELLTPPAPPARRQRRDEEPLRPQPSQRIRVGWRPKPRVLQREKRPRPRRALEQRHEKPQSGRP